MEKVDPVEKKKAKAFVIKNLIAFFVLLWLSFYTYQFIPSWAVVPFIFTSATAILIPVFLIVMIMVSSIAERSK